MNTETPDVLPDHTRLSASGAERWMNCPGSQVLAERLGLTGEESEYAAEGTAAHELAEMCMKTGAEAWEYLEEFVYIDYEVTEEMSNAVQMYLDECRALMRKYPDAIVLIEQRVDNKDLHPDFGGMSDFTLITPEIIFTRDFKYGVGISKDAIKNPQMRYYGIGNFFKLPVEHRETIQIFNNGIVQPRGFHPAGEIRAEVVPRDELLKWWKLELQPAMKAVDEPNAPLKAGEHCRFCPAIIGCPIMQAMAKAAAKAKSEDAQLWTDEELGLEYEALAPVRMYLKAIQGEAYARAVKGKEIPGGKIVRGRADRVLNDGADKEAIEKWGDEAYTDRKIKSPAQLAKLLGGKTFVSANAHKPEGKLSFVPLDHKSAAVKITTPSEKFKGIKSAHNS